MHKTCERKTKRRSGKAMGKTHTGKARAALKIKWKWIARLNFNGASGTLMFTQVEIESLAARLVTERPRSPITLSLSLSLYCPAAYAGHFRPATFCTTTKGKLTKIKKNAKNIMKNICAKTARKNSEIKQEWKVKQRQKWRQVKANF